MGEKLKRLDEKQETGSLKSLASFIPPAPFIIVCEYFINPVSITAKNVLYFLQMFFIFVMLSFSFQEGFPTGTPCTRYAGSKKSIK